MKTYAIILASGSGNRFGTEKPKQLLKLAGKTILEHTIDIFENNNKVDKIIIVIHPLYRYFIEELVIQNKYSKIVKILKGGLTRKESSFIGINAIEENEANVLIHDSVRPFLTDTIINECLKALEKYDAVDVAIPSADTLIEVKNNQIISIPDRDIILRGQTPQCFKLSLIKKAHELSRYDNNFTDDCGLVVKYNLAPVYVVQGEQRNIKITYPEDMILADKLFQFGNEIKLKQTISELKERVIVVFGGNSGIGKCIAEQAQLYGAKVFSYSRSNQCDISVYEQIENALESVYQLEGKIDYIINTAGLLEMGRLQDRDISDIYNEIMINYIGSIGIAKAGIKYLSKTKGGILFFTSSSYTRGRALYAIYSSCKAAVVNLVQALSEELRSENISINVINPERTATPMRYRAFGKEEANTLLEPQKVASVALEVLVNGCSGKIIDVRK